MKTAISVDLGGTPYSLDQDAFLTLHAYLDRATERLGEHPDRDEVLAGLERSIGTKLARGGERSAPIGAAEMAATLREVGKVEGLDSVPSVPTRDPTSSPPRRQACRLREPGGRALGLRSRLAHVLRSRFRDVPCFVCRRPTAASALPARRRQEDRGRLLGAQRLT